MKKTGYDAIGLDYQKGYGENLEIKTAIKWLSNQLHQNDRVLDVGSGPGLVAKQLSEAGLQVLGIDNSNEMNRIARKQAPEARFIEMNFKKLALKESDFDAIVAFFSLLHVQKGIFKRTLQNLLQHLKPYGYFIFSMVEGDTDGEDYYMNQKVYFSAYPREKLIQMIESIDLTIVKFKEHVFLPKVEGAEEEIQLFFYLKK